jgi:hypothetical protein
MSPPVPGNHDPEVVHPWASGKVGNLGILVIDGIFGEFVIARPIRFR